MKSVIRSFPWLGPAAALVAVLAPAPAAATATTDPADFLALSRLPAECLATTPPPDTEHCYLQNFNGFTSGLKPNTLAIAGTDFAYSISAGIQLAVSGGINKFLTTRFSGNEITIDVTASPIPIRAVSGNFFTVNASGNPTIGDINVKIVYTMGPEEITTLSSLGSGLGRNDFFGVAATYPAYITRLIVAPVASSGFLALDNLLVGVPEPSSLLLVGAAGIGWWVARKKPAG